MHNPYKDVNTETYTQVMTTTHDHIWDDNDITAPAGDAFNYLYNGGVRCLAISNYYPSEPMYPIANYTELIQREPPSDIVEFPNAEHHHFSVKGRFGNSLHMNSLGSTFSSGHVKGVTPTGYYGKAEQFVKDALSDLLYQDGGGITLNHPGWTQRQSTFPDELFIYMLDQDERVLGIEIFNSDYTDHANDVALWDKILNTGRNCYGFAVPDHRARRSVDWMGRIMLYVPEFTAHACLKAIRKGEFYAKLKNTELIFSKIAIENNSFVVKTNESATIRFIADGETIKESTSVSEESCSLSGIKNYIRAEAETENDKLFTQPIMMWIRHRGMNSNTTLEIELYYS